MNRMQKRALEATSSAHFIHDGLTDGVYFLIPIWAELLGLTHLQLGALRSLLSGSMAVFQIPFSMLAVRVGARAVLVAGTLLAGGGYVLLGYATEYWGLLFALFVVGLGAASQHPQASAILSRVAEEKNRRTLLGSYNFFGDVGKVFIPLLLTLFVAFGSWVIGVELIGFLAIMIAGLLFILLDTNVSPPLIEKSNYRTWGISNLRGYTLLTAITITDAGVRAGLLTFLPVLIMSNSGDVTTVGFGLSLLLAGGALGKLLCGCLADKVGPVSVAVSTELLTAIGIYTLLVPSSINWIWFLPLLGMALNGTSSVLLGSVSDYLVPSSQTKGYGLYYTFSVAAGAVTPLVLGLVSDLNNLYAVFYMLITLSIIAAVLCCFLPRPKHVQHAS